MKFYFGFYKSFAPTIHYYYYSGLCIYISTLVMKTNPTIFSISTCMQDIHVLYSVNCTSSLLRAGSISLAISQATSIAD